MDISSGQVFILITTTFILFLVLLMVNLLLGARNSRLKHESEIVKLNAKIDSEVARARMEVNESAINEVARDLHDDVGQMVTFSIMQINSLQQKVTSEQALVLDETRETMRQALNSIRSLSKSMSKDYIATFGLINGIKNLEERLAKSAEINFHKSIANGIKFLSPSNEVFTFRIIQECVNNTLKYAAAKNIIVDLVDKDGIIYLTYEDDGKGFDFDPNEMSNNTGLGLTSVKNRVNLMSGKITFHRREPNGVKIEVSFPNK